MVRKGLAKFVKNVGGFLAALSHSKKNPPAPGPPQGGRPARA